MEWESLTNQYGPNVDEYKERHVCKLLKWKEKYEHMIWHALAEPVQGVEGVAGEWGWHDPLMMWLVQSFVHQGMVQSSVDPVDTKVGETDENGELQNVVPHARPIRCCIIQLRVSTNLAQEEGEREDGHDRERLPSSGEFPSAFDSSKIWDAKRLPCRIRRHTRALQIQSR